MPRSEVPGQELLWLMCPLLLAQHCASSAALRWPRRVVLLWCPSLPCDPTGARAESSSALGSAFPSSVSWGSLESLKK